MGNRQANGLGRIKKPVNVFFQPEHPPLIKSDAFKNPVAVKQAVIEHGDLGVFLVIELSVQINFHDALFRSSGKMSKLTPDFSSTSFSLQRGSATSFKHPSARLRTGPRAEKLRKFSFGAIGAEGGIPEDRGKEIGRDHALSKPEGFHGAGKLLRAQGRVG